MGDGLAELPPYARVLERRLERALGDSERERRQPDTAAIQRPHEVRKPCPFLSQSVLDRHFDVLEDEPPGIRGSPSQLVLFLRRPESGERRERRIVADAYGACFLEIRCLFRQ